MNLSTDRMWYAGQPRPEDGKGFGPIFENGYYVNYLHGLDFLCRKHVKKDTRVLELGCFYGASSELFSEYSDNITCVDIEFYPEMQNLVTRKNIKFFKNDSVNFLSQLEKNSFDLIYIDTSHDFGQVKKETQLSYNLLEHGKVIAGHDYNSPGVHNAILDVFEYPDIEIFLDSSWAIVKTDTLKLK
ncbi:MAG: class I SAM-dependent methyltransferase [Proteobacteria bacterium]|nr:class I SAM-dependent methyltransferase [Pseudomonadota bacterium]NBP15963.1 class I SAM-dependent methyltransferase [bacterium]